MRVETRRAAASRSARGRLASGRGSSRRLRCRPVTPRPDEDGCDQKLLAAGRSLAVAASRTQSGLLLAEVWLI